MEKKKVFEEKIEDKVLFHYTTLDTFYNIVKSGELRLYDVTKSNDPLEGRFAINALEKAYKNLYDEKKICKDKYHVAHASLFEFNCNNRIYGRTSDLYAAASFCSSKHEMTMLRCYANNGKGVAIGFPANKLLSLAEENDGMEFRKIQYLTDEEMSKNAEEFWLNIFKDCNISLLNISDEEAMEPLIKKIEEFVYEGLFIKHIANKDEEEYRLLCKVNDLFQISIFTRTLDDRIDFYCGDNDIKAYYKIPVKELISHVLIGPASNVSPTEMKAFLDKYEINSYPVEKITWINMR